MTLNTAGAQGGEHLQQRRHNYLRMTECGMWGQSSQLTQFEKMRFNAGQRRGSCAFNIREPFIS
jgi:hypothetical protein